MRARVDGPVLPALLVSALLVAGLGPMTSRSTAATAPVDEVIYAYGDDRTEVVVSWRGAAATLSYGTGVTYDWQVAATPSAITPVDVSGPFQ